MIGVGGGTGGAGAGVSSEGAADGGGGVSPSGLIIVGCICESNLLAWNTNRGKLLLRNVFFYQSA